MRYARPVKGGSMAELTVDLDRSSPVPLYFQVAAADRGGHRGAASSPPATGWRTRSASPTGSGLSRPTMRRAIQELVDKGLLVRKRGSAPRSCTARSSARSS